MDKNRISETPQKKYKLLGADGRFYLSDEKGTLGGNIRAKIYGRLDCPSALSSIKRWGEAYTQSRVFFKDEETAVAAGFRPCGTCMRDKYNAWKKAQADDSVSKKKYKLLGADGKFYFSDTPGTFDGWTKGKIYGRLDCPKTKSELERGHLQKTRVFFKDEETAIAAGYRPCYFCMREKFEEWQQKQDLEKNL